VNAYRSCRSIHDRELMQHGEIVGPSNRSSVYRPRRHTIQTNPHYAEALAARGWQRSRDHLYEARRAPPAIHRACGLVMDAYEQVAARADAGHDVRNADGHHPVDYWTAAQQAKLNAAAELVRNPRRSRTGGGMSPSASPTPLRPSTPQVVAQAIAVQGMEQQGD
jgi:hypothetical protein